MHSSVFFLKNLNEESRVNISKHTFPVPIFGLIKSIHNLMLKYLIVIRYVVHSLLLWFSFTGKVEDLIWTLHELHLYLAMKSFFICSIIYCTCFLADFTESDLMHLWKVHQLFIGYIVDINPISRNGVRMRICAEPVHWYCTLIIVIVNISRKRKTIMPWCI